ncbi:hypothetical protein [Synechococcus sp. MIT S1220]|uniref:hypothetical protein n=1 Tax=Synechococcus sp. MIT S1220 TaxID=3082549 RepID=UPI0039AED2DD
MPIHPIDGKPIIRVETRVGDEWVDLEATDYREKEYGKNQQREPRRRFVLEPLPGTEAPQTQTAEPEPAPVEVSGDMEKAMNEDLRKRGLANRPKTVKPPKPKNTPKL